MVIKNSLGNQNLIFTLDYTDYNQPPTRLPRNCSSQNIQYNLVKDLLKNNLLWGRRTDNTFRFNLSTAKIFYYRVGSNLMDCQKERAHLCLLFGLQLRLWFRHFIRTFRSLEFNSGVEVFMRRLFLIIIAA